MKSVYLSVLVALCVCSVSTHWQRRQNRHGPCARFQGTFSMRRPMPGRPQLVCDDDGFFGPVQCRGSMCYCTTQMGRRIENPNNVGRHYYQANRWETINCKCARAEVEFLASGAVGMVFNCEENGNYAPIQCRGSMCYCADSEGEQIANGESVPLWERDTLNCDRTTRPEPQGTCAQREAELARQDERPGMQQVVCDADGFYAPVQCRGSVCNCTTKYGESIVNPNIPGHNYQAHRWEASNCNCARAEAEFIASGMLGLTFDCLENGNYGPIQCRGTMCFCADANGEQMENGPTSLVWEKDSLSC